MEDVAPAIRQKVQLIRQRFDYDRWREDGFDSRDDAMLWSNRCCGTACVAMAIGYLTDRQPSKVELLRQCLALGGYSRRGWIHSKLLALAGEYGIHGFCLNGESAQLKQILSLVLQNCVVIASVTEQFPEDGRKGGHLVCITGYTGTPSAPTTIYFNDPSAWGQTHSEVTANRFRASYSMAAVVLTSQEDLRLPAGVHEQRENGPRALARRAIRRLCKGFPDS